METITREQLQKDLHWRRFLGIILAQHSSHEETKKALLAHAEEIGFEHNHKHFAKIEFDKVPHYIAYDAKTFITNPGKDPGIAISVTALYLFDDEKEYELQKVAQEQLT